MNSQNKHKGHSVSPIIMPGLKMYRASKKEFPVLKGLTVQTLHLEPGSHRTIHLHPDAEQVDYCISGKARVGLMGPHGEKQTMDLDPGDMSFIPRGYPHWIENIGSGELIAILILNNEEAATIELPDMDIITSKGVLRV
jgi:oxalate decarboxylase/phosphoglucose isomerase-like protein (cupin superfamily)